MAMEYTVTIKDTVHELDTDEGQFVWKMMPPPICTCGTTLGAYCDEDSRDVSIHAFWHDDYAVECDNCGVRFPVIMGRRIGS